MNPSIVKIISLAIIGLAFSFVVFKGNRSIKKAKKQVEKLELHIDSLEEISGEYELLKLSYDSVHTNMTATRNKLVSVTTRLNGSGMSHVAGLAEIREELKAILQGELFAVEVATEDVDSLRF